MKEIVRKTIFALVFALTLPAVSSAQIVGGLSFKADAGISMSYGDLKVNSANLSSTPVIGYRLYAGVDIDLLAGLYVNPGIALQMKGSNAKLKDLSPIVGAPDKDVFRTRTHQLIVPIHAGYKIPLFGRASIDLQTGPYFAFVMSKSQDIRLASDSPLNNSGEYLTGLLSSKQNNWDMGWGAAVYVNVSRFYVNLTADFGFINTVKSIEQAKAKMLNTALTAGFGVRL